MKSVSGSAVGASVLGGTRLGYRVRCLPAVTEAEGRAKHLPVHDGDHAHDHDSR